ncbi:MAG TPA: enoyl-CoA hydratase [Burkholderiaceae bacterium]|nr:enoyl-CoA hydratase [Burkholderiaceae bacterium]
MAEISQAETMPLVLVTRAGAVTTITLNRGEQLNALSEQMIAVLQEQFNNLSRDSATRVIVLAAAGKAFCAGHDLKQMLAAPSEQYYKILFDRCSKLMLTIQRLPQPVIARVHGVATAAGCQLVSMCDLAVASDNAKFAVSGINFGLFCSTPAVGLSRNVSRKQAMEMLLTGEFIDAQTALQRGLVNRVATPELLDREIEKLAASIIAKPPKAVALGKQLFYKQLEMGIDAAYQLAGQTMACNMMDDAALEGVQAFIEKRAPAWR